MATLQKIHRLSPMCITHAPRRVRIHAHRYAIIYTHRFNRSNNPYRLSPMRIAHALVGCAFMRTDTRSLIRTDTQSFCAMRYRA